MAYSAPYTSPLARDRRARVLGDLLPGSLVRDLLLILGSAAVIGGAAQLSFPLPHTPVPVTGQTFAVLLTGAALGWRRALASTGVYLLAGAAGTPWFTHHGHGTAGPSFGYIIGFILAATVVGFLAQHGGDRTPARTVASMLVGTVLIYAVGVPYLMSDLHVGLHTAFSLGVRDFLPGDILKVLVAAALLPGTWRLLGNESRPGSRR